MLLKPPGKTLHILYIYIHTHTHTHLFIYFFNLSIFMYKVEEQLVRFRGHQSTLYNDRQVTLRIRAADSKIVEKGWKCRRD